MVSLLKGTIVGLVLTVALYLVPGVNILSPFIGRIAYLTFGGATARKGIKGGLEVWPESHWPGFALRHADVLQSYTA